jgi:signal transduction histidine kinase
MSSPDQAPADVGDGTSSLARGAALVAAVLATAAALALALLALLQGDATVASTVSFEWLAATVACTATAVAWASWRQHELTSALRDARLEVRGLLDLLDTWHWRSDSAHRLTLLRPPLDAGDEHWPVSGGVGQIVWEHFGADSAAGAALRVRLESGAHLVGLRAWLRDDHGTRRQVELRGSAVLDKNGRVAGYLGSARVIDDAARDKRLFHALLDALPVPVFVLEGNADTPSQVQQGNDAAAKWLGLEPAQLVGLDFTDLQSRLPRELRAALSQALAAGDGAAPQPVGAGWTVRARPIAALPAAGNAADSVARLWMLTFVAAPGDDAGTAQESFGYTVSHDLRAPIRVVEGFTRILKEDYGRQLDRIGNDHLDRVLGAAARMNSMIDALLALSQLSSGPLSRQPVNLSQLASYVVEDLRRQSPERSVAVHIEAGLQTQGDPTLLRMVLENLLGNAWKYSAKTSAAQIWLERRLHDGQPVFSVRDNGAGFDMRFAGRLFGVFQRLHSANDFPGTGVGLASVRRIINRHGGEVWAESVVDRGSTFHFTLPADNAAP